MALTGYKKVCAKRNGGIRTIEIIEASDLSSLTYDDEQGVFTDMAINQGSSFATYAFLEDGAQYQESVTLRDGVLVVEHQLSFSLGRIDSASNASVDALVAASYNGVVAVVTTNAGEKFVVGYSLEFGTERPLRVKSAQADSAAKLSDGMKQEIVLSCYDVAKAKSFTGLID